MRIFEQLTDELTPVIAVEPYTSEWCRSYKHTSELTMLCSWTAILPCHRYDLHHIPTGVPTTEVSAVLGRSLGIYSIDL